MDLNSKEMQKYNNQQYVQNKRMEIQSRQTQLAIERKNSEIADNAVESFAGEIIADNGGYEGENKKADIAKNYIREMKTQGAAMAQAIADAGKDVPATAGIFASEWDEWTADGKNAPAKSLWLYKGIGYQARVETQKIEAFAPDVATNNYAVRPVPDAQGIYPATINMDVAIGMKLRGSDGIVYECYANPIASLQWQPADVPASFRVYEG